MVSTTTYAALFNILGGTYGLNVTDGTFGLPNLIDKFIQGSQSAGTLKNAGLPNITGSLGADGNFLSDANSNDITQVGALYISKTATTIGMQNSGSGSNYPQEFTFDASRSNSIYGNSTTVQPPALTMRFYIKY